LALLLDDEGLPKKVRRDARLPDGQEEERSAERLAFHERRALERFLKRMDCTAEEWKKRRRHYLEAPLDDEELRSSTWKAAKVRHCGRPSVERALQRQRTLSPDLWMIAFLMAQGNKRDDLPPLIGLKKRRVCMLIDELRSVVLREIHTDTDSAVTRWFLGL
jgi:hypothetical protein